MHSTIRLRLPHNCQPKRSFYCVKVQQLVTSTRCQSCGIVKRNRTVFAGLVGGPSPYWVKFRAPSNRSNRMTPVKRKRIISRTYCMNWPTVLTAVSKHQHLTQEQAAWAMKEMMSGIATDAQIAGFLMALATKGETVEELLGRADAMLDEAVDVDLPSDVFDMVGTGGDRLGSVKLSTRASVVAAGAGSRIFKQGVRGCPAPAAPAAVVEALGVHLTLPQGRATQSLDEAGITFLFAQESHPSLRYIAPARKQLGGPTAFNYLGPLSDPV